MWACHSRSRSSLARGAAGTVLPPAQSPWTKLLPAWLWLLRLLCGVFKDKRCRPGWAWSAGLPEPNAQSPRRARPTTFGLILVLIVFPRCFRQVLGRCEAFTRARQESTRQPACTRDGQLQCPRWTSRRATVGPASPSACVPRSGRLPNLPRSPAREAVSSVVPAHKATGPP